MILRGMWLLLLLSCCAQQRLLGQSEAVSFNLSTSRSFAPDEQPQIHLYTHNVDALEFRIYRVNDPARFLENLRELHSFGSESPFGPTERIDERTWIERFHDWKEEMWERLRSFVRDQFSRGARRSLRAGQSAISRRSRLVNEAQFAQIPILNDRQLVARWRQTVPSTYISDNNDLDVKKLSAGLYLVEATDGRFKAYTLLAVSPSVLVTRTSPEGVLAYVVDRGSGAPVAGVAVAAGFGQQQAAQGTTGADGVVKLAVAGSKAEQDNFWVVGTKGADTEIATPGSYGLQAADSRRWVGYIVTDRPVYRPGHTVHWKATVREHAGNTLAVPKPGSVRVQIVDEQNTAVFDGKLPMSRTGALAGDFMLPADASLGYYSIRVGEADAAVEGGDFHVEEYRKPEYQVQVTAAQKRIVEGQPMSVTIDGRYFFGEPVANGKVKYRVYRERHYWDGEQDESSDAEDTAAGDEDSGDAGDAQEEKTGKLDADGKLVVTVPTPVDEKPPFGDYDYRVEAGVTDPSNREITGRGSFLATYSNFRVVVEPISYAVHAGEAARFRVRAVDYDGKPVETRVHVQLLYRHVENGQTETTTAGAVDVQTDAEGAATGALPLRSKQYSTAVLLATATQAGGMRAPTDESYVWVLGAGEDAYGEDAAGSAQILADKRSYAPGETAHLSLVSDAAGFHALVVVQGNAVLQREVMSSEGRTLSFDVPITAEAQPNVIVEAVYVRDGVLYQASKTLKVPPVQQQLQVQIAPTRQQFEPQQDAEYDVTTLDAAGRPVSAELSFGVVDEAIYSLYPDASGDMVRRLYPQRESEALIDSSLSFYFAGEAGTKSPMLAMRSARYRPQLAQVKPGNEAKPRVRKAFPDTAFWAANVRTDAGGHARVRLRFPDSLTTWRATVHAMTDDAKAGSAISRVLVRKNVLVRMGTPRFLLKGDEVVVPVTVHNYLDSPQQAKLSLAAAGVEVVSGSEQSVTVASKGEATAMWRLRAKEVGTAKLTATALTPAESDALEVSFPVEPEGVVQTVAQGGVMAPASGEVQQSITFPGGTDPAAHSLRIDVSSSVAGSLTAALDYLTSFPYGCTEQTMSSFLPNVMVAETLRKLRPANQVDAGDLQAKMEAGLDRLADYQHDDGGWGWWKEDRSQVYMTAYVVGGLGQGSEYLHFNNKQSGMLAKGQEFLRGELQEHPRMRPDLRAAVVYALAESGDKSLQTPLETQWQRRRDLSPEALAMTGLAMAKTGDTRAGQVAAMLEAGAVRQGELVSWKGSYLPLLDAAYEDDAEATAYAVRLIAKVDPGSALLPAAAQWLMLNRNGDGWWDSTEQTAMVLFGLVDYLAASHELESDFTVDVLVNGRAVGQRHFTPADAASGASLRVQLPASQLQPGSNTVELRRSGAGRMYWSASGRYYSTDRKQYQAGTMALNLTRDYYRLQPQQKDGKLAYTLEPLHGKVQIGDVLAVHEAINGTAMKYLLLEDPIPAGTEFVRNEGSYPIESRPGGWEDWYMRREFHDDRAAFFATNFAGREEIYYLLKVVNPGSFAVSPARVAPMYQPGVQATSDASQLQVPAPATAGVP